MSVWWQLGLALLSGFGLMAVVVVGSLWMIGMLVQTWEDEANGICAIHPDTACEPRTNRCPAPLSKRVKDKFGNPMAYLTSVPPPPVAKPTLHTRTVCCCAYDPPGLRCSYCIAGQHDGCLDNRNVSTYY